MKKICIVLSCLVALSVAAQAQAQEFDPATIDEQGALSILKTQSLSRAQDSRFIAWQKSNGELGKLKVDRHYLGVSIGATYIDGSAYFLDQKLSPTLGVSFGKDGGYLWTVRRIVNGEVRRVPVRLFSYELHAELMPCRYRSDAVSVGDGYLTGQAGAFGKVKLFEDRWLRHRVNAVVGVGVILNKHDYKDVSEDVIEIGTGNIINITDDVDKSGYGVYYSAGLEYRCRPSRYSSNSLCFKVMADLRPEVHHNKTKHAIGGTLVVSYTFALHAKVK